MRAIRLPLLLALLLCGVAAVGRAETDGNVAQIFVTKTFTPTTIGVNGTSVVTITLTNQSGVTYNITSLGDTYPVNMVNAAVPNAANTCGGTVTAAAGGNSLTLTGGSIPAAGGNCNVTVTVTSATAGLYQNTTGPLTGTPALFSVQGSASLLVLANPTVSKAFAPATVQTGANSVLTITIGNTNAVAITGAALTDTYPLNVVNALVPNATTTCIGGTLTAAAGGNSVGITNATIPPNGCTITVAVKSDTAGTYVNTIPAGGLSSANAGANPAAASATLVVLGPPTATKTFTPAAIAPGGTSQLTIAITNPNTVDLLASGLSDIYPPAITNSPTPNGSTTCPGGLVLAPANSTVLLLAAATIPVAGCTVTVTVTSSTIGTHTNTIPPGGLTTASAGSNTAPISAQLAVLAPPTITKAFAPTPIAAGATSTLTITLTNPNAAILTGAAFTDTYPANLVNASSFAGSTTCAGGTVTAAAGGGSVALAGGSIPANGSCTVSIAVTSAMPGTYTNTLPAGALTTNGGPNVIAATGQLVVNPLSAPTVTKAFAPATIFVGQPSTLTITLSNGNLVAITGAAFTDTYPATLVNAAAPNAANTCGGTVTAAGGGSSVALANGTIPANSSCTVTVAVTSDTPGAKMNVIAAGAVTSANAPANTAQATATLNVNALLPPVVSKSFAPSTIFVGQTSTLTVTLDNVNAIAMTGLAFTDNYPATVLNAAVPNAATTCGGTVTAAAGGSSVALANGTIPANSSCTVTVTVTSSVPGPKVNTIPAGGVTATNAPASTGAATATLTVNSLAAPTLTKAFAPSTIIIGQPSTLTLTLNNSNPLAMTGVAFTDNYPENVVNAAAPNAATTCGGTVTAAAGGTSVALNNGTVAANGSCTVTVTVISNTAGTYVNTVPAGAVTSGNALPSAAAAAAPLNVNALPAPTVSKTIVTGLPIPGAAATLTVTLTNPSAIAITGATFTDTYPAGLVNATPANGATTCAGGTVTATNGAGSLALTGGTIPANGSCTVTVAVTSSTKGAYTNIIPAGGVTSTNALPSATAAIAAVIFDSSIPIPTLSGWMLLALSLLLGGFAFGAMRLSRPEQKSLD